MIHARPFHLRIALLALVALAGFAGCLAEDVADLGAGEAELADVTCGGKYPNAEAPYAQRPDGCSSWSNNPDQVRDSWGSADFRPTCNDHDRCYYTLGSNVDQCNAAFCAGLERACRHAYCVKSTGYRLCEPATLTACLGIAETYCGAVRAVAADVYHEAQDKQRDWETCVAQEPSPPPPTCANGKPEGATWQTKRPGTECELVTYRCSHQQIVEVGSSRVPRCIER